MTRILLTLSIVTFLLVNVGCGTLCNRRPLCRSNAPAKQIYVPPPPPVPVQGPLVPAGAIGPPTNAFPTVPPSGPAFGQPGASFPNVPPGGNPPSFPSMPPGGNPPPPSITPIPPKDPRTESKWAPVEGNLPRVEGNAQRPESNTPRVQLYAPETLEKEPPPNQKSASPMPTTFPPIAQFAEAKDKIYGGLRPSGAGLDWLQANRVGTIVQVRLPGDEDGGIKKLAEDRGMRFVAFEVSKDTLTKEKADEFIKLIRESTPQKVFVFDADGALNGAMFYLYMRWGEVLDDETSQFHARQLGLQNTREGQHRDMWVAVQKLISENNR